MNCPVLLQYPDQFISNTKVVRNSSTNPDTQPTRGSDVHDTSGMNPPLRTPCPVITRSRYSSPDEFPLRGTCIVPTLEHRLKFIYCDMLLIAMIALYLLFLPLFYCPVVSTTAADALVIDYVVDGR